jgi:hypothetical protein
MPPVRWLAAFWWEALLHSERSGGGIVIIRGKYTKYIKYIK